MSRALTKLALAGALAAGLGGCGGDGGGARDEPARPPAGWHTVRNEDASFTVAVPRSWRARTRDEATLLRSGDGLAVITIAADTSSSSGELSLGHYARRTLQELPEFEGSVAPRTSRVAGSPYRSARVEAVGTVRTNNQGQRITVAALRRGDTTYVVVAFRNARAPRSANERTLNGVLASLRAGAG